MVEDAVALYCDGGVVKSNPSRLGGTWAWCAVAQDGGVIEEHSGLILAADFPYQQVTNNQTELIAAILALEAVPEGWSGTLYTDSQLTIGRLFDSYPLRNIPNEWVRRHYEVTKRLNLVSDVTGVLLKGHPTIADLTVGWHAKTGRQVSMHNVRMDWLCQGQATRYLKQKEQADGSAKIWASEVVGATSR